MLTQNLPIKRTASLDSQGDAKKARHTSGAVGSPDSQGSRTTEVGKPIEKMYCDAVVNFLLKIACQVCDRGHNCVLVALKVNRVW